jgi:serine/threonine protein kinase
MDDAKPSDSTVDRPPVNDKPKLDDLMTYANKQLAYLKDYPLRRKIKLIYPVSSEAQGSAGAVYKAEAVPGFPLEVSGTTAETNVVAVKIFHPSRYNDYNKLSPAQIDQNRRRLHREVQLLKSLHTYLKRMNRGLFTPHYEKHIVQCFVGSEIGSSPGSEVGYIIMEYVEGQNLEQYVTKKKQLDVDEALRIGIPISIVLEAAHELDIMHRDVKPRNVLIDSNEVVKVGDWGLAKRSIDFLTDNRTEVAGTPAFSPVEQFDTGLPVEKRSDVYSLGTTLYYLLTGVSPYESEADLKDTHKEVKPISDFRDDVPKEVESAVMRFMARKAGERPGISIARQTLESLV